MSRVRRNAAANIVRTVWVSALSLAFVPLYIGYLGIEAWGLVGFFVVLQGVLSVADAGLSTALSRELARTGAVSASVRDRRDLVRTLEFAYWAIAVCVGMAIICTAPSIAERWLRAERLPLDVVILSVRMMGTIVILQFPSSLYSGGLLGLQQQIRLNVINVISATIRSLGAVGVLAFVSPTVIAYFTWQLAISGMTTIAMGWMLWRAIGGGVEWPRFRRELLAGVWRFSAGMFGIAVTGTLLSQADKVVLSRTLTLEAFGYYALATVVAGVLIRVVAPLYAAYFPRFTELVASGDEGGLARSYHAACQLVTVLVMPAAWVLALFSREILQLWTRNATTADRTYAVAALLVLGSALNALMHMPLALQLAYGWTSLSFYSNLITCVVLVPLVIWLSVDYGALGGASVWLVLNAGYVVVIIRRMHRRVLPGEAAHWYVSDVGLPALAALGVAVAARLAFPQYAGPTVQVLFLGVSGICAVVVAAVAAPAVRKSAAHVLGR